MGANRPPACERKAYIEIDLKALEETGEYIVVGSPIIAPTITEKVPRGKFEITYTAELFNIMKSLGNKKIEVLTYILDHKDGNNSLNASNTELATLTHTSRPTVIETIKTLHEAGLVERKGTVLMINPHLMVKGNQLREAWLMRKYEEISDRQEIVKVEKKCDTPEPIDAIDVEVDDQLSFTEDGKIVQKATNAR